MNLFIIQACPAVISSNYIYFFSSELLIINYLGKILVDFSTLILSIYMK